MEIIGSEGALYIGCGRPGLEIHDGRGIQLPETHYWPRLQGRRGGALAAELSYFADCILNDHPPERITPQEPRNAVALMEAAEQSSRAGQALAL